MDIHKKLRCDSIVQLIGCTFLRSQVYVVTEFIDGANLDSFLFDGDDKWEDMYKQLTESQLAHMCFDMASACQYLHESQITPIIHRDIKPGNFVVRESDMAVKLIDLGIGKVRTAQTLGKTAFNTEIAGTWSYCAPEKLLYMKDGNKAIDVWSLGCCIAELLSHEEIWKVKESEDETDVIKARMQHNADPYAVTKMKNSPHIGIVRNMLSYVSKMRPTAGLVANYFKEFFVNQE